MNNNYILNDSATNIFEDFESQARSYGPNFQKIFTHAHGSYIFDTNGEKYLDFLTCAGALNYGHNHEKLKVSAINFIKSNGLQGSLDFYTNTKKEFIESFQNIMLKPRNLDYKIQFTSPTGTSVVESAIKLARKATSRRKIISFTGAYHGMTGTSLGLTGNKYNRQCVLDNEIYHMPFENYWPNLNALELFEYFLRDNHSGYEVPAAVILETVQGEGGINVASTNWLQQLRGITLKHDIILIIDDVQVGCGRTGKFFSFEESGILPDMVCLSKSLSGYGYPLSLLLHLPKFDLWKPGEDNGTFRGNSLAMVTGKTALELFWKNNDLVDQMVKKELVIKNKLQILKQKFPQHIKDCRGRGMIYGIEFLDQHIAEEVSIECFNRKLIIERCGSNGQVIKLLPSLNISEDDLLNGLNIIYQSVLKIF